MISDFKDEYFRYDVRLAGTCYLGDVTEKITMEESLDELALRVNLTVIVTPDFPFIGGETIEIMTPCRYLTNDGIFTKRQ